MGDRYNAACSWALAGNKDSAFFNLMRIATKSDFTGVSQLQQDNDLDALRSDKRWDELMAIVQQNKDKAEGTINSALAAELDTIMNDDQDDRRRVEEMEKKYGHSSKEVTELWTVINRKDSVNLINVTAILDKYGWVGADVAGRQGNMTIFLVIQHADLKTQEHYLPMMRAAVKDKKAEPFSLAMLEDRVALRTGKKQIYGSQIGTRADGSYYVDDLEDPDNVDKRRAEGVGLGPIDAVCAALGGRPGMWLPIKSNYQKLKKCTRIKCPIKNEIMKQYLLETSAVWLVSLAVFDFFLQKENYHGYNRFYLLFTLLLGVARPPDSRPDIPFVTTCNFCK